MPLTRRRAPLGRHGRLVAFAVAMAAATALPAQSAGVTLSDAEVERLRRTLLIGSVLTETAAITSNVPIPYLGVGFAAQKQWGRTTAYGLTEVTLLLARQHLRRGVPASDLQRFPIVNLDTLSVRSTGRSADGHARFQAFDFVHHSAYYARMIDIGASYQQAHARWPNARVSLDRSPPGRLLLAPFVPKDLTSPWTFVPIVAAGLSGLASAPSPRPLGEVTRMTVLGRSMSRNTATAAVLGYQALYLLSTAVGEELFFRGLLQTELTERYSRPIAMIGSTAAFAAFHIPNKGVSGGLIAAAAGAYFGHRFQKNGYNLREVVAMHFWLDFLPTAVQFVRDPRSGSPVYDVRWPAR